MRKEIIETPSALVSFIRSLKNIVALDTETSDLNYLKLEIEGISLCDGKYACYINLKNNPERDRLLDILGYWIDEVDPLLIFFNAPYDLSVLYKYGIEPKNIFDTQVGWHLLDENVKDKSLKKAARVLLGVPEDNIRAYSDVDNSNLTDFASYAIFDAVWTYQLYQRFLPQIKDQCLEKVFYEIEMPFQFVLRDLNINGALVDKQAASDMLYNTRHLYYQLEKDMLDLWGGEWLVKCTPRSKVVTVEPSINFNSSPQVIPLIESLGFKIYEKSRKGAKSWGKLAKERLAGQHPFIDMLIKYSKIQKLVSSFLEPFGGFVDEDGRIRASFNNCVTVTGRLSCSRPNLEQLPKNNDIANIRNLFIAGENRVLIVADYKGQELRTLAVESNDVGLRKAFEDGLDLHQQVADELDMERNDAKRVSFGVPYGKGPYGFAKDFHCTEKEAQAFLEKYFNKYPRVRTRIEQIKKTVYVQGYVTNMNGRRRRFPGFEKLNHWGKERCYRQAVNFVLGQSPGADVMKVAPAEIIKDKNLKIVNLIHDEVCVECPKEYWEEGMEYINYCMVNALKMSIPWETELFLGERYGEAKG